MTQATTTELSPHLKDLENESIHIIREVAGQFDKIGLLFSGGKDSCVVLELARRAFAPAAMPIELLHVDTGHNFPEVIQFRDELVEKHGLRLRVAEVQDWIDRGDLQERPDGTRNPLQTVPLVETIAEVGYNAVLGGARGIALPSIYFAHDREVFGRDGMWLTPGEWGGPREGEELQTRRVRYRTVGDMSCTGAVDSDASTIDEVLVEIANSTLTERGATRADDRLSESAMEDRKKEGYF